MYKIDRKTTDSDLKLPQKSDDKLVKLEQSKS